MEPNIQAKLDKYLELYRQIREKTQDEILARVMMQELAKDKRMQEIREERAMRNGEPATTRQLQFMKKLGIEIPPGVTKQQASMLIDEELAGENAQH